MKFLDKELLMISVLENAQVIPKDAVFDITEYQLNKYIELYHNTFNKCQGGIKSTTNARYARKLAGLTLLKINKHRGASISDLKAGIVYLISNPAFIEHFKVGMTLDVQDRLSQYQTYDPYRQFKIEKYEFVLNRRHIEEILLAHPDMFNETGEWVRRENAIKIFSKVCIP